MRRALAATLLALMVVGCTPIDPHHPAAEQKDMGHVDTGGGGGGAM